ncbi:hypothetical protein [Methylotenera sp.]|uniref:hypothetical protein n=1 Tax=Methylotenera sp. TaxID=2051956 RepID=UPI002735832B|nr:hypothetical protein [Methylotenera sp.]MDP3210610.1 hypothetical protein [Methylotenera sp.]
MKTLEEETLLNELTEKHGEIVSLDSLSKIIGYKTVAAVKYAIKKEQLSINTFYIKGRKGRYAMTRDVASWLIECKENNSQITYPNNLRVNGK